MEMLLTPEIVGKNLAYGLFTRLFDSFRSHERIIIEITSPGYEKVSLWWDLLVWEKGERRTIIIEGPPGFCHAVLQGLWKAGESFTVVNRLPLIKAKRKEQKRKGMSPA